MNRKITKRFTALLLAVLLCAAACLTVFADSKTYTVKECDNLQITLPDNMTAITRSSEANDGYFSLHSLDYNKVMSDFQNGDIYLQAMDNVETITVSLSCLETEESQSIGNYNKLTAGDLDQVARNFISESGGEVSYNAATLDEAGKEIVWLYFNMTGKDHNGDSFRQYQANTVYDGKSVSVTLYRNGGDVAVEDYAILAGIVSTVKFHEENKPFLSDMMLYIIIGGVVLAIILLIIILAIVKKSKKRKKKNQNDKIIQELAGKYQTRQSNTTYSDDEDDNYTDVSSYNETDAQESYEADTAAEKDYDLDAFDDDIADRKYSDADIARLLGDIEDDENFIDTLPATQADSDEASEVRDSVIVEADAISEFFEDEPEETEPAQAPVAEEPAISAYPEIPAEEFAVEEMPDEIPAEPAPTEDEKEADSDDEPDESDTEEVDEEFEEYSSDEVLVREESNQEKFKNSSDFFEEAPKKIMGVISSKEIEEAEEYDVIGEVEQRAEAIEKEPPKKGEGFSKAMKAIGGGLKSFGVHCGYFAANVKRSVKRKRAMNKRKKAEEERRRRQMERRQQQRAVKERRRDENGLVQVHRRDDRRPNNRR